MPEHKPADLSVDVMIEYIARGHGFNKHVLGTDDTASMAGINGFRKEIDNLGREIKGGDLKIETPDDLAHYIGRMVDDINTVGFRDQNGATTLYNTSNNVIAHFTPGGEKLLDFGSAYRYADSDQKYDAYKTNLNIQVTTEFNNGINPNSVREGLEEMVTELKANPQNYMKAVNVQNPVYESKMLSTPDRPGRGWMQDEIIKPVNNIVGHSEAYATANNLDVDPATYIRMEDHVDKELNVKELRKATISAANEAGEEMTAKLGHDFTPDVKLSDHFADIKDKTLLRRAFDTAVPALKTTGMVVLGAIPIIGMLPNTAEAAELKEKLATAIDNGQVPPEAVAEYNIIMGGHIAQGADPTVVLGEAGVQQSFNDWADRYNIQGELRDSLQPSSLALMLKDGGVYIAENIERLPSATVDVAKFTGEVAVTAGEISAESFDNAYDYFSGNTKTTMELYDALPSVDMKDAMAGALTGDHASLNEREDILNLLQSKARAEYFENKMNTEEDPDRQAYYADRLKAAQDNFETSVEAMDEGQLNDVQDYLATYNQYIEGNAAENANVPTPDTMPLNPDLLGTQPAATSNRMAV